MAASSSLVAAAGHSRASVSALHWYSVDSGGPWLRAGSGSGLYREAHRSADALCRYPLAKRQGGSNPGYRCMTKPRPLDGRSWLPVCTAAAALTGSCKLRGLSSGGQCIARTLPWAERDCAGSPGCYGNRDCAPYPDPYRFPRLQQRL